MDWVIGFLVGLFFWGFFEASVFMFWGFIYELGVARKEGDGILPFLLKRWDIHTGLIFFPLLSAYIFTEMLAWSESYWLLGIGLVCAALVYRPFLRDR